MFFCEQSYIDDVLTQNSQNAQRFYLKFKIYSDMEGLEYTEFVADCVTTAGA